MPRRVDEWPLSVQDSVLVVLVSREGGFPPKHGPKNVAHAVDVQLLREKLPRGARKAGMVLMRRTTGAGSRGAAKDLGPG